MYRDFATIISLRCDLSRLPWLSTQQNDKSRLTTRMLQYLIVPVGEGTGEAMLESDCGMFIRRGGRSFVRGGLGTRFGVLSLTNDVNRTFTFVDGNRNTQLKETNQQNLSLENGKHKIWVARKTLRNISQQRVKFVYIHIRQFQWRCSSSVENTVNKYPVLAIATEIEIRTFVLQLQVLPWNETGMPHVYVHAAKTAVSSDDNPALPNQIFELATFKFGYGSYSVDTGP